MSVNAQLLKKTLAYIETHPEEWDQGNWAYKRTCKTAFCFAGHALIQSGYEILWDLEDRETSEDDTRTELFWSGYTCIAPDLTRPRIPAAAAEVLGLSEDQASWLFSASNSLIRLRIGVQYFIDNQNEHRKYYYTNLNNLVAEAEES